MLYRECKNCLNSGRVVRETLQTHIVSLILQHGPSSCLVIFPRGTLRCRAVSRRESSNLFSTKPCSRASKSSEDCIPSLLYSGIAFRRITVVRRELPPSPCPSRKQLSPCPSCSRPRRKQSRVACTAKSTTSQFQQALRSFAVSNDSYRKNLCWLSAARRIGPSAASAYASRHGIPLSAPTGAAEAPVEVVEAGADSMAAAGVAEDVAVTDTGVFGPGRGGGRE